MYVCIRWAMRTVYTVCTVCTVSTICTVCGTVFSFSIICMMFTVLTYVCTVHTLCMMCSVCTAQCVLYVWCVCIAVISNFSSNSSKCWREMKRSMPFCSVITSCTSEWHRGSFLAMGSQKASTNSYL